MKKKALVIAFATCSLLTAFGICANSVAAQKDIHKDSKKYIEDAMQEKYGEIKLEKDDKKYEDLYNESITEYMDDSYEYVYDDDGKLKSAILRNKNGKSLYGNISNELEARRNAKDFFEKISPDYFKGEYDIVVSEHDGTDGKGYNVEFWEKIQEKTYTGNKVLIILDSDGYVNSYVAHENMDYDKAEKMDAAVIQEKEAVNVAFDKAEEITEEIESAYNSEKTDAGESIVLDAELLGNKEDLGELQELDIKIEDRESCEVESYNEIVNGKLVWMVNISNVTSNNKYGDMGFQVVVDAQTGEVISANTTR